MLRVNTSDGLTASFDIRDEEQARAVLTKLRDASFQARVRAVSACDDRLQCALARPDGFRDVFFEVEDVESGHGGERVVVQADDVRLAVMVHAERPAVRVALLKVGRRRYNPFAG